MATQKRVARMKIAVLGWGSLIWCPGTLNVRSRWHKDGPYLPIEFAHKSRDKRLTLVILPGCADQRTYWALSGFPDLKSAVTNLKFREGCSDEKKIHFVAGTNRRGDEEIIDKVSEWLLGKQELGAAIWTGLGGWKNFTPEAAIHHLDSLKGTDLDRAREYVRNAPEQMQTEVRRRLKDRDADWCDNRLPKILFA